MKTDLQILSKQKLKSKKDKLLLFPSYIVLSFLFSYLII